MCVRGEVRWIPTFDLAGVDAESGLEGWWPGEGVVGHVSRVTCVSTSRAHITEVRAWRGRQRQTERQRDGDRDRDTDRVIQSDPECPTY